MPARVERPGVTATVPSPWRLHVVLRDRHLARDHALDAPQPAVIVDRGGLARAPGHDHGGVAAVPDPGAAAGGRRRPIAARPAPAPACSAPRPSRSSRSALMRAVIAPMSASATAASSRAISVSEFVPAASGSPIRSLWPTPGDRATAVTCAAACGRTAPGCACTRRPSWSRVRSRDPRPGRRPAPSSPCAARSAAGPGAPSPGSAR